MNAPATTSDIVAALHASEDRQSALLKSLTAELLTARNLATELQMQNRHQAEVIERQQAIITAAEVRNANLCIAIRNCLAEEGALAKIDGEVQNSLQDDTERFHAERPSLSAFIVSVDEPAPRPSQRDVEGEAQKAVAEELDRSDMDGFGIAAGVDDNGEFRTNIGGVEDDGAPIPESIRRDREPGLLEHAGRAAAALVGLYFSSTWLFAGLA